MGDVSAMILRRTVSAVFVLWLIVTLVFFFLRLAGDPVAGIVGEDASPEALAAARVRLGLDLPLHEQYWRYWAGLLRGDFGTSFRFNAPAMPIVLERLPATLLLGAWALALAIAVSVPIGVIAALKPGSLIDSISRIMAVVGQSMPAFWLGILLVLLFAVNLGWFPTSGTGSWRHIVLPSVALSVYSIPLTMRLVRSSMLEVLGEEYVKSARAKGLQERVVIVRHALRNALIPVITVIALRVGHVLSGAVVLEEVFAYPGMGRLAIASMIQLDFDVIQAFAFVVAALVVGTNLIADILYGLVDPRIRVR